MRTAKILIRSGECSRWSESSLGTKVISLDLSCCGSNYTDCSSTDKKIPGEHSVKVHVGEKMLLEFQRNRYGDNWAVSIEFGTIAYASSEGSGQNLRCSLIQAVNQEEPSDRKPDPWPLWMTVHVQLKFVMTECSKTQICLTRHNLWIISIFLHKKWGCFKDEILMNSYNMFLRTSVLLWRIVSLASFGLIFVLRPFNIF